MSQAGRRGRRVRLPRDGGVAERPVVDLGPTPGGQGPGFPARRWCGFSRPGGGLGAGQGPKGSARSLI
ncbi:hypothetical protein GCM10010495_26140 [Kitasatospora herbaricolor]|nr:hypothetical protein GCM10010495_26140 [Kitasatospora herbaricolor]